MTTPRIASLIAVGLLLALALAAALLPSFMPSRDEEARHLAALGIFTGSYLALAIGKVPGLAIDRAGVALVHYTVSQEQEGRKVPASQTAAGSLESQAGGLQQAVERFRLG